MAKPSGPWITAAYFSLDVQEGPSGEFLGAADVKDNLILTVGDRPFVPQPLWLIIGIAYDGPPRQATLSIRMTRPDGTAGDIPPISLKLQSRPPTTVVQSSIRLQMDMPEMFWFDIAVDNRVLTRTPFLVVHEQAATPTSHQA